MDMSNTNVRVRESACLCTMGVEILSSDMGDTVTFDQVLPWRLLRRYRHKELQKGTLTDEVGAVPTYVSSTR